MIFDDRRQAGAELAAKLSKYRRNARAIVIGLPRGGVVTAAEVARRLDLPMDIIVPRKLGAPNNPEYAIGALTEDGTPVWNEAEKKAADPVYLEKVMADEKAEARRRLVLYRGSRPELNLIGLTAIIVDDGLATGFTMRAAVRSAKAKGAERVVVAVPHGAADSLAAVAKEVDEVVAVEQPAWYGSVGEYYRDFPQVEDQEVISIMSNF